MLIDYIDQHRDWFGVEPICAVLTEAGVKIAPSTYYAAKTSPASARSVRGAELVADVKVAQRANLGVYGARKIHADLNRGGTDPCLEGREEARSDERPVDAGPRPSDRERQSLRLASRLVRVRFRLRPGQADLRTPVLGRVHDAGVSLLFSATALG